MDVSVTHCRLWVGSGSFLPEVRRAGVTVIPVNSAGTSQMCSCCLYIGFRRGARFACVNCGASLNADLNGAINLATVGATVTWPENAPLCCHLHLGMADAAGLIRG